MTNTISYSVFHPIAKSTFGFRECSILVKIANNTDTKIEIIANNRKGNSDSILSLMKLGIVANTPIIFTISGTNQIECVHQVMDLFNEGWQPEHTKLINDLNENKLDNDLNKNDNLNDKEIKKNLIKENIELCNKFILDSNQYKSIFDQSLENIKKICNQGNVNNDQKFDIECYSFNNEKNFDNKIKSLYDEKYCYNDY